MGIMLALLTLSLALIYLGPYGFVVILEDDGFLLYFHAILGCILVVIIFCQGANGLFTKYSQNNELLTT
jgi:hypothetical protein